MEKKKTDFSPYLGVNEKLLYKTRAASSSAAYTELTFAFLLALFTIAGDCFLVGVAYSLQKTVKIEPWYIYVIIGCTFVHIVPFVGWIMAILIKIIKKTDVWYAFTDKRFAIVSGVKPVSVTFINLAEITAFRTDKNAIVLFLGEEKVKIKGLKDTSVLSELFEKVVLDDECDLSDLDEIIDHAEDELQQEQSNDSGVTEENLNEESENNE